MTAFQYACRVYGQGSHSGTGKWFPGGRLNIAAAALDRDNAGNPALIWAEESSPNKFQKMSLPDLRQESLEIAASLASMNMKPGIVQFLEKIGTTICWTHQSWILYYTHFTEWQRCNLTSAYDAWKMVRNAHHLLKEPSGELHESHENFAAPQLRLLSFISIKSRMQICFSSFSTCRAHCYAALHANFLWSLLTSELLSQAPV